MGRYLWREEMQKIVCCWITLATQWRQLTPGASKSRWRSPGARTRPMAQTSVQGVEKNMGAGGRDETGHRPQTQIFGHMATRSQHKALLHLMGKLVY